MSTYIGNPDFQHGEITKIGVLLCNLGTPEAPTAAAVRRYLAEFLSDPRVVEIPRIAWLPILHGIILRVRPRRSAAAYEQVWTEEGSPLLSISGRQAMAIAARLEEKYPQRFAVELGMRYGTPSIATALRALAAHNVRDVLVLPLYPQYAAATTASAMDAVSAELARWRWLPSLRFVSNYHDDTGYLDALAASVRRFRGEHGAGEHLLMSFHGIPQRAFLAGDPYHCHCHATARLLAERLALPAEDWTLGFQSRFGRAQWLQPYTATVLERLAAQGVRTVDVVCPGFAADCLETLEEIALQYAELFHDAGGTALRYIPALNDDAAHIDALVAIIERNLPTASVPAASASQRAQSARLAEALRTRMNA